MPCYDGRDSDREIFYKNGINPEPLEYEIRELKRRNDFLEAGLCAIITELEKKNIANEIISKASRSGLIDLISFWREHNNEDVTRLAKELHKFSEHEQDLLRLLLNNKL